MKVILLYPPVMATDDVSKIVSHITKNRDRFCIPLGLLSVASVLIAQGHNVTVYNLAAALQSQLEPFLKTHRADVWGMTCFSFNRHMVTRIAIMIKSIHRESTVVIGGPHATFMASQLLNHCPAIDIVVLGEGESTVIDLIERLARGEIAGIPGTACMSSGEVVWGPPRKPIEYLDTLPPLWPHFNYNCLVTSRGCKGRCYFCSSPALWRRRVRYRSARNVLKEIDELRKRYRNWYFAFKDDTFPSSPERTLELCNRLSRKPYGIYWSCDARCDDVNLNLLRQMRQAGCFQVSFGVESGSRRTLRKIGKDLDPEQTLQATQDCKRLGMLVRFYLIFGNIDEELSDLDETVRLVEKANPDFCLVYRLQLYPGTRAYAIAKKRGIIDDSFWIKSGEEYASWPLKKDEEQVFERARYLRERYGERIIGPPSTNVLESALKLTPNAAELYCDLGRRHLEDGNFTIALKNFSTALTLGSARRSSTLFAIGGIQLAQGDYAKAVQTFSHLLSENPAFGPTKLGLSLAKDGLDKPLHRTQERPIKLPPSFFLPLVEDPPFAPSFQILDDAPVPNRVSQ